MSSFFFLSFFSSLSSFNTRAGTDVFNFNCSVSLACLLLNTTDFQYGRNGLGRGEGWQELSSYIIDGRFPKIFPENTKYGWLHVLESEIVPLSDPEQISFQYKWENTACIPDKMFRDKQGCIPPKDPEKYDDILRI